MMRGKWLWLIYPVALVTLIRTALAAFSVPWRWTEDQVFFLFLVVCVVVGLGSWIVVWMRGGTAAVKARWAALQVRTGESMTGKNFRRWFFFWLALLIGLAIYFDFSQH